MDAASGVLVFVLIWVVVFLVAVQIRPHTQDDAGEIVPGTPASAPRNFDMKKKLRITTLVAVVVWAAVAWVITSGVATLDDLDIVSRFGPGAGR
jgi:predicted secreted protein